MGATGSVLGVSDSLLDLRTNHEVSVRNILVSDRLG